MNARTRIKFCGITRIEDALLAAELGVDYLGLVQVPGTPRWRDLATAAALRAQLPAGPQIVVLVQNPADADLQEIRAVLRPDLLQFHGAEPPAQVRACGLPYLRAVPMGEPQDWSVWERDYPDTVALLADSHRASGGGGSGHAFAWSALPAPEARQRPLMLAGGLTPETVAEAIRTVRPWGVDVSSGIEGDAKGLKDALRMRAFVAAVRAADAQLEA